MNKIKVIKEKDKNIEFKTPNKKTVILCSNGFQNSDTHDSCQLIEYFNKNFKNDYPLCEIAPVALYEPGDKKAHKAKVFKKRFEKAIEKYHEQGYDIILLGYSFSASLACRMQVKYPYIKRLVLVAPVYDTILNNMIPGYISYAYKFHKLCKKYGQKVANAMGRKTTDGLVGLLLAILKSVLLNRFYYRKIKCDTLILWGTDDKLCTKHSMKKVNRLIKSSHILYKYEGMTHALLKSIKEDAIVFDDILHFTFNTPYLTEVDTLNVDKVKRLSVKIDEDGEVIPTFGEIFNDIDPDADSETIYEQSAL